MLVVFVTVQVLPEYVPAFIAATEKNHAGSVQEPGCERFDVLRDQADANRFYLYEVYRDATANAAHKETAHYQAWASAVAPMMAAPRTSIKTESLFPAPWA